MLTTRDSQTSAPIGPQRNRTRPRIVLLSPPGDLGRIVARSLAALDAETLLVCEPMSSVRLSSRIGRTLLARAGVFDHPEWVVQSINAEHRANGVDAVIATSVPGLEILTKIRDQIRPPVFPMVDGQVLNSLNDKWLFSRVCAECDVNTPKTLFFGDLSTVCFQNVRREVGYPCVVKPLDGSGGDGVRVLADEADLENALRALAVFLKKGVLLQEFVSGDDVGLSVFASAGKIRNWTTFYCDGFWSTRFRDIPELLSAGRRIIEHVDFTGVANFDARRDRKTGKVTLLECNPRFFRRVGAARLNGLDFVGAGLAALSLADEQPASLTQGQHLSVRDIFRLEGMRMVIAGRYPLRALRHDALDFLRDPAPPICALLKEGLQQVLRSAVRGTGRRT